MAFGQNLPKELDKLHPPQSSDTEKDLLGAILKDGEAMHRVIEILEEESSFYVPKHQIIYGAILRLYAKGEPADITTVANELNVSGNLEKIGGRTYLVELAEGVVSSGNVEKYANIVSDKHVLRQLIATSNEITRTAFAQDQDVEELLDAAEGNIFKLSESKLRTGFVSLKTLANDVVAQIERFQTGEGILDGVLTGFPELDRITQGLHNGDFVVVAGRPSMGKSAFAMNIAENIAMQKGRSQAVAVFSLEMAQEQLALRILCGLSSTTQQKLRAKRLTETEWMNLMKHVNDMSQMPIYIDDSPVLTTLQLRAKARRLKAQAPNLGLIIVDYLQMMHASGRAENRQQEIATISRGLKALAKELNVPVVVCSQLSRAVEQREDKRPQLADLRESGAIEQDADVVVFVYRPEYYLNEDERQDPKNFDKLGVAELIVAKQRNGPTGTAKLTFLKEFAQFKNMETRRRDLPGDVEPVDTNVPF